MTTGKTDIWVYAHWQGMPAPKCIGILSAHRAKGRKAFSFEYDSYWIRTHERIHLDPDIEWYGGAQFPAGKENFGFFLDSMPDRWGRMLMKRRASFQARESGKPVPVLHDIDFLLGVQDVSRMGALRFKLAPDGPFLHHDPISAIPPIASIGELQQAAIALESDEKSPSLNHWLSVLIAPGSSLGGARPKANVIDQSGNIWIAKFPSHHDLYDVAAWEFLLYRLALNAGIPMAESKLMRVSGTHQTFLTNRFDRISGERIHFASAMTMTGHSEDTLKEHTPSYLELAEFILSAGAEVKTDLNQLWRRIVFNIAVSNTDDHLRNHGFLLTNKGWRLSPAYDLNPNIEKDGLSLNIDLDDATLDFDLARSIGEYCRLTIPEMSRILKEVDDSVKKWKSIATEIGISRQEQIEMEPAFHLTSS